MTSVSEDRQQRLNPGMALKVPCKVASIGVLVLSGEQVIDGVAVVSGDRVLVKNQASSIDNGIYVVSTGAWSRAQDFDGTYDASEGTLLLVNRGSSLGRFYRLTSTADPVIFGTSAIVFQLSTEVPVPLASFPQIVDTIAALKAVANPAASAVTYLVRGVTSVADGGGGFYIWNVADVRADDGVSVIAPNAGAGRWNLLCYMVHAGPPLTGPTNVACGPLALNSNQYGGVGVGDVNTAFGANALTANTTGRANTAYGWNALAANTIGTQNAALTSQALSSNVGGSNNLAVGNGALFDKVTGDSNIGIGVDSLRLLTGAAENVAIGVTALSADLTGSGNVAIGHAALDHALGASNVGIGNRAGRWETGSNALYIDNQDRTNTAGDKAGAIIYGQFSATVASQRLQLNAVVTKPVQPAFLATATLTANATGDATSATVIWGTEIYDQHADFTANTFTAPVTGRYHFDVEMSGNGLAAGSSLFLCTLVTSNRSIVLVQYNPGPIISGGELLVSGGCDVDMDAGDTATVTFRADGTAKVVGYKANSTFSGHLVC